MIVGIIKINTLLCLVVSIAALFLILILLNLLCKIHQTIKSLNLPDFDTGGNVRKTGRKPKLSDLEVISLNLTSEYM